MANKEKYRAETVKKLIEATGGNLSAVAAQLGCDRATVYNYVKRHPTLKRALQQQREKLIDWAETVITEAIQEKDVQTAKWVLATIGKKRGWGEKLDVKHSGKVFVPQTFDEWLRYEMEQKNKTAK